MSTSDGGGVTAPCDRLLNRKSSKSRLEKQQEVEAEEPPAGGRSETTTSRVNPPCSSIAEVASAAASAVELEEPKQLRSAVSLDSSPSVLKKIQIPETRVETVDIVDIDCDEKGAHTKSKILVRSHAMCGDDDTKLNARLVEQSSKGSAGSSLSRDSSNELYTDSTGINLEDFIISTLHKNPRDRTFLLDLEQTVIRFIHETGKQIHRFPAMSSYNRMLVHRVSAFFGLDHNVDQTGQAVVVSKMQTTRIPDVPFKDYIKHDIYTDEPKKVLLKRDAQSYEETQVRSSGQPFDIRKARSFEEREEEYAIVRARIFNQQDSSSSVEGVIESPVRPWSSTDSSSDQSQVPFIQLQRSQLMQKAGSFGGVSAALCRTDATTKVSPRRSNTESNRDHGSFTRQPTIPEAVSGPASPIIPAGQPVIFAVVSIEQVPPGAIIINAQTGQPYLNPDGTIYRHGALAPQRPLSSSPQASPAMYSSMPNLHPSFCGTSLPSDIGAAGVSAQMHQLSMLHHHHSAGPAPVESSSHATLAPPPPQVYLGPPQVYTYVVSPQHQDQQQQQSPQAPPSEGNPRRFPAGVAGQQMTILPTNPASGYAVQSLPVQYQESIPCAMHAGDIVYTQAPSQSTVAVASSATASSYPLYYPGQHPTPTTAMGVRMTSSPMAHTMLTATGVSPYGGGGQFLPRCPSVPIIAGPSTSLVAVETHQHIDLAPSGASPASAAASTGASSGTADPGAA